MSETALHALDAASPPLPIEPVIAGFYPDPTICRVGEDYYLANSSFEYFPGVPIFHSADLVSWTQIGNALDRRSQMRLDAPGASRGIYAPTLRHHDGKFWLITTNISDGRGGQLLVTATDAAGPWSEPVFIPEARGIDPDLCWADGICYLTWKVLDLVGSEGEGDISQAPLDTTTGRLLEPAYPVWQGTGMMAAEGPHLYHVDRLWYLMLAEGGTERGHSVTIARSSSPRGPFEACPSNPILTHRSTGHPIQNVGHADLVQTPSGEWAAVYLGTRPAGSTPGFHTNGRETFLAGIEWVDGWPVFDEQRYSPRGGQHDFSDDFSSPVLDFRWVTPDGEPGTATSPSGDGGILLHPRGGAPALCTRVRDRHWSAEALFESDGCFHVRIDPRHWYGIRIEDGVVLAEARIGDIHRVVATRPAVAGSRLRIASRPPLMRAAPLGHAGPDDIVLSMVVDDRSIELARLDGRYLSTEVAAGFTGRMLAVGAANADALLRSVRYTREQR
jgi:hypothetical protein